MPRVLVIGYAPESVDFSDPAVPPGLNEQAVAEGLKDDIRKMRARGFEAEHLPIGMKGDEIRAKIREKLSAATYDCIVIGAGVRMTTKHVAELEIVVNAIRDHAPHTPIAFNAGPNRGFGSAVPCKAGSVAGRQPSLRAQ